MNKMIKVLIVEDEMLLLQGLKKLVDWQALGFTLCETATNYMDEWKARKSGGNTVRGLIRQDIDPVD